MLDIAVVGGGPVGHTFAALAAKQGLDVAVFERYDDPYGLPRAIRFDHEALRIWQSLGIAERLLEDAVPTNAYLWFGADGDPIVDFEFRSGPSGWHFAYTFFQPHLETALEDALHASGAVLHRGHELVGLTQHDEHVELQLRLTPATRDATVGEFGRAAEMQTVAARHVVAADGARSTARDLIGIEFEDLGFNERWLVIDVRPMNPKIEFPPFPQQFCDPARPHMWAPNGKRHRRWEFMLLPGERAEEFDDVERVWSMLQPWLRPGDGEIVRSKVYEFQSRVARSMRSGRCFLAGDAAHLMPPHMGEGLCSGVRDASALAWRLAAVHNGAANSEILDSYESERLPHARALVEQSQAMGQLSCVLDPAVAAERDETIRSSGVLEPWPFPGLGPGLGHTGSRAVPALRGYLSVQGRVSQGGLTGLLDDVVGRGFQLICEPGVAYRELLTAVQLEELAGLGCQMIGLGDDVVELDGAMSGWLRENGAVAVLVRPDFYVYGAVSDLAALPELVDSALMTFAPSSRPATV